MHHSLRVGRKGMRQITTITLAKHNLSNEMEAIIENKKVPRALINLAISHQH